MTTANKPTAIPLPLSICLQLRRLVERRPNAGIEVIVDALDIIMNLIIIFSYPGYLAVEAGDRIGERGTEEKARGSRA